jgi:predicted O-linked N-acetylglucosamine transferase (SPINDLY family)
VATSLVRAAGIEELVMADAEAYVSSAIRLGNSKATTDALRTKLNAQRASAPFFDTARLVRGLEAAYDGMIAAKIRASAGL